MTQPRPSTRRLSLSPPRGADMTLPLWSFDDPTMTWDNPLFTFDGSSPSFPNTTVVRVQAATAGTYNGTFRDVGDVFDVAATLFSDATLSQVPVGDPDYPLYGWMLQVVAGTPLYSWASANGGASSPSTPVRRIVL